MSCFQLETPVAEVLCNLINLFKEKKQCQLLIPQSHKALFSYHKIKGYR